MGDRRRVSLWIMLVAVAAAGAFAWMGSPVLFAVFALLLAGAGAFHWAYACRRCTNADCAVNARGDCFAFGPSRSPGDGGVRQQPFSDLQAMVAAPPLVVAIVVGTYGAWLFSPLAALACVAVLGAGFAVYAGVTCTNCVNRCPLNRNEAYRAWRADRVQ